MIIKASRSGMIGHGGNCRSIPVLTEDRRLGGSSISGGARLRETGVDIERMSGAGYVAVNGFERPRTAPAVRTRKVEVRTGRIDPLRSGMTPPKRINPAMLQAAGRPRRPAGPKRGQVKAAIAHSLLQTLSSIVQGARDVALRRSFSWHS